MRVHRLWIREHRVLRELALEFTPIVDAGGGAAESAHTLHLLVGVNGTGKSTVLRALADVFRQIEGGTTEDDLRFSITYELSPGGRVTIENVDERGESLDSGFRVQIGDGEFRLEPSVQQFAPDRYVTYTTGDDARWSEGTGGAPFRVSSGAWGKAMEGPYWRKERSGIPPSPEVEDAELPGGQIHIRSQDLPLVTLCGLLEHAARTQEGAASREVLDDVLAELGISHMTAFSLRFYQESGGGTREDRERIAALRAIASRVRVQGASLLLVFDLRERPGDFREKLRTALSRESTLGVFQELARYSRPRGEYRPLLQRLDMFFEKAADGEDRAPELHTYDWLSDGERTFLARMCMLSLFGAADALILLDEPEVHFNDYWKRKLVRMLDASLQGHRSHVILTTHSSIVLTDVRKGQILVLRRGPDGYTRDAQNPDVSTFAADPSDVLVQVFGAEQASGDKGVEEVRELLTRLDGAAPAVRLNAREREELRARLERALADLAPGYWRFRVRDALEQLPPRPDAAQA